MGAAGTTVTGDEGGHRKSGVEEKDLFEYELQYHNVSKNLYLFYFFYLFISGMLSMMK